MHIQAFLFIFLYGLCGIIGLFLAVFWGRLAHRRLKVIDYPWYRDRYYLISVAVTLLAGGQAIVDAARTVGNIEYGLSPILTHTEGWFVFLGMFTLLLGLITMVWVADLETHPPSWRWLRRMLIFTVFWLVVSFFVHYYVPLVPQP